MVKYSKRDYKFVKFQRSTNPKKKYDAVLKNKETGREVKVRFGDRSLPQYKDTALGLYKSKDTLDKNKRRAFRARFSGLKQKQDWTNYYTPLQFAWNRLW